MQFAEIGGGPLFFINLPQSGCIICCCNMGRILERVSFITSFLLHCVNMFR